MKSASINDILVHSELELYIKRIEQTLDHLERHIQGAKHVARNLSNDPDFQEQINRRLTQMAVQNEVGQMATEWLRRDIKSPF
jgi:hypothetical protein